MPLPASALLCIYQCIFKLRPNFADSGIISHTSATSCKHQQYLAYIRDILQTWNMNCMLFCNELAIFCVHRTWFYLYNPFAFISTFFKLRYYFASICTILQTQVLFGMHKWYLTCISNILHSNPMILNLYAMFCMHQWQFAYISTILQACTLFQKYCHFASSDAILQAQVPLGMLWCCLQS